MGESNRRKKLDPNYGKGLGQARKWIEQMKKSLPSDCHPDGGHYLYLNGTTLHLALQSGFGLVPDRYGWLINFSDGSLCYSIIVNHSDAQKLFSPSILSKGKQFIQPNTLSIALTCVPCPKGRFKARNGEWVLPLIGTPLKSNLN